MKWIFKTQRFKIPEFIFMHNTIGIRKTIIIVNKVLFHINLNKNNRRISPWLKKENKTDSIRMKAEK